MIVTILLALVLSNNHRCLASYYYQTQPQVPIGLRYVGYQQNDQSYQNAPAIQYYTSNHIQSPVVASSPFTYPSASYFQRTFLTPQPFYNAPPATVHIQQPSPVILRYSTPIIINNTLSPASPQMRGFIYHTDLEGGARSNVVFLSGPSPNNLFEKPQNTPVSTMRTPSADSMDTVAIESSPAAPVDNFQALLALLNPKPSDNAPQLQDGILYSGLSNTNRVVINNRFLATEDDTTTEQLLPILRSSFIGRRVTASEPLMAQVNAKEEESKDIDVEMKEAVTTTPETMIASTTTVVSSTMDVPVTTITTAATSTSSTPLTTPVKRMAPIVVLEMTET